jgi:hypothetical protein
MFFEPLLPFETAWVTNALFKISSVAALYERRSVTATLRFLIHAPILPHAAAYVQ